MLLIVDNYDSFTYNLVQYFGELGAEMKIVRNDEFTTEELLQLSPSRICLSPGPCSPDEAGVCLDLIAKSVGKVPLLGVCLGHQSIAQAFGGKVIRAERLMHGKTSQIHHQGKSVFLQIESPFQATRYHSLIVERSSLPACLEITAETDQGEIMGLQHRELPVHGVQFHPESILTNHGKTLLKNFLEL